MAQFTFYVYYRTEPRMLFRKTEGTPNIDVEKLFSQFGNFLSLKWAAKSGFFRLSV
jgi:hypothetical protein